MFASKSIKRPIKWTCDRSEAFLSDAHGRDHVTTAQLALDKDGHFLALKAETTANLGAYLSTFSTSVPTILHATLLAGQYKTPKIHCQVTAVFTNTAPVDAYRGAPAGPRPPTWWSASSKPLRVKWAWTRPKSVAATSSPASPMPHRWA